MHRGGVRSSLVQIELEHGLRVPASRRDLSVDEIEPPVHFDGRFMLFGAFLPTVKPAQGGLQLHFGLVQFLSHCFRVTIKAKESLSGKQDVALGPTRLGRLGNGLCFLRRDERLFQFCHVGLVLRVVWVQVVGKQQRGTGGD